MANVLKTGDLTIPTQMLDPWVQNIHNGSAISQLSGAIPMKFGKGEAFTFDIGEAEYVGEGAAKGGSTITSKPQGTEPFKFHKTVRWNEEVLWADQDHQLDVVRQILALIQPALSRALDFGMIHGINPTGGAEVAAMTQRLAAATNVVEFDPATEKPYVATDAANALIMANGGVPTGIAIDPEFGATISGVRKPDGSKLYSDYTFANDTAIFESLRAATSRTVGAKGVAATDTNILGVVGNYSAARWGIQKSIGLELIKYGDPDGQGDLKRYNQVAFRAEVVYGWGIAELDRNFAVIKKPAEVTP